MSRRLGQVSFQEVNIVCAVIRSDRSNHWLIRAMDGARGLQLCRASASESVERCVNLRERLCWPYLGPTYPHQIVRLNAMLDRAYIHQIALSNTISAKLVSDNSFRHALPPRADLA